MMSALNHWVEGVEPSRVVPLGTESVSRGAIPIRQTEVTHSYLQHIHASVSLLRENRLFEYIRLDRRMSGQTFRPLGRGGGGGGRNPSVGAWYSLSGHESKCEDVVQ